MKKMNVFLNINIEAKKLSSWILLSVLGILWGSSFLSVKYAINAFDPLLIASFRIVIGFLVVFMFSLILKIQIFNRLAIDREHVSGIWQQEVLYILARSQPRVDLVGRDAEKVL